MSSAVWIVCLSVCWIAVSYYFLFKRQTSANVASHRKDEDVIAFHPPAQVPRDDPAQTHQQVVINIEPDPANDVTPQSPEPISISEEEINDEDLIDIRTLSLNIPNKNQTS